MKRISRELKTTALFKCLATFKNGRHVIITGLSVFLVGQVVAGFRTQQKSLFNDRYVIDINGTSYDISRFSHIKFINQRTGEELLSIA